MEKYTTEKKTDTQAPHAKKGFSLVELAIVLVIIGLIVGGILTGQDLIKASELNSVISEKNKFQTAINTFRLKYNGMPGDLRNATSYWTSGTTNGGGNGLIDPYNESYRAWQHLTLAGLIPGSYSGTHTTGGSVLDTNTPASTLKPAGWGFFSSTTAWVTASRSGNKLSLGIASSSNIPREDAMTPADAYGIDSKIDDGLPAMGTVYGGGPGATDCSSSAASTGAYRLNLTTVICGLVFVLD